MDSNRFARFPFSFLRLLRESVGRSAAPVDEAKSSVDGDMQYWLTL